MGRHFGAVASNERGYGVLILSLGWVYGEHRLLSLAPDAVAIAIAIYLIYVLLFLILLMLLL